MKDLHIQLARTLEISPDDILTFKAYPTGYSVITTDYRKFTGVQPAVGADPRVCPSTDPPEYDPIDYPEGLPDELQPIFDNPQDHTVPELRKFTAAYAIRGGNTMRKAELITAIEKWKEAAVNS